MANTKTNSRLSGKYFTLLTRNKGAAFDAAVLEVPSGAGIVYARSESRGLVGFFYDDQGIFNADEASNAVKDILKESSDPSDILDGGGSVILATLGTEASLNDSVLSLALEEGYLKIDDLPAIDEANNDIEITYFNMQLME